MKTQVLSTPTLEAKNKHYLIHSLICLLSFILMACGANPSAKDQDDDDHDGDQSKSEQNIIKLEYEKKTKALVETSQKLQEVEEEIKEQNWRLKSVCADHGDHQACQPYTNAQKAKEIFCSDEKITDHIEEIINSCHQGQCKQLDQAQQINRNQMMLLLQSLPHLLVQFKANQTKLDRKDHEEIQKFLEMIEGNDGYVMIVGRASKDGAWKKNIELAVQRAENTRKYLVSEMGIDQKNTGYITYGEEKMYLTETDVKRLGKKLSVTQANRSAFLFSYPCDLKKKKKK
jgi:outer membrane protein OmpA-like peptidoglycan-associated protein